MPSEPRGAFLLVRRLADLRRTSEELADYLSMLQRWSPGSTPATLRGIWIDEDGVANLPSELVLPDAGGRRTLRILETAGINGIWMLCRLEAAAPSVSRIDLAAALLECFGYLETETATLAARFLPVFAGDTPDRSANSELHALEVRYPGLAPAAVHLDGHGGLLLPQTLMDIQGERS
ncbi:MAG: hypothetical protein MZV65_23650 [Chromatiales bacterium]|nr:hypothetical protein [Chromatiales bacterium]